MTNGLVYLDLFSGTGGFALGLQQAGIPVSKHYFSEIDKHAIANYQYHFKHAIYAGSIEQIKKIQQPDLVTFGFPCQDLSISGNRAGLEGKRSGLFFEAMRIIREYKPRVFIFENVTGLFTSNQGKDFEVVLETVAHLGLYECQWQLLNSGWFLPQHRQRVYFVGILRSQPRCTVFPFRESDAVFESITQRTEKTFQEKIGANSLPVKYFSYDNLGRGKFSQNGKVYNPMVKAPTLTLGGDIKIFLPEGIRKLTPLEYERLQGFPDNWTQFGLYGNEVKKIPMTYRYDLCGNAVSVPVVREVMNRLKPLLVDSTTNYTIVEGISEKEMVLYGLDEKKEKKEKFVPEIFIRYKSDEEKPRTKVTQSRDAADFLRGLFQPDTIEVQEEFMVLYLNRLGEIKGYYRHTKGSLTGVMVDLKHILAGAVKSLSSSIIVSHNHPSGNENPSDGDRALTQKLLQAADIFDIKVLDHIILTKENYFSFADQGMMERTKKTGDNIAMETKNERYSANRPEEVSLISKDVEFIKKVLNLNKKEKTPEQLLSLIRSMQRAIEQKQIRKSSPYAKEIQKLQEALIGFYNQHKGKSKFVITLDNLTMDILNKIIGSQTVYPSIKYIKQYIGLQGKEVDREKVKSLMKNIVNAIIKKSIPASDPYLTKLKEILKKLKVHLDERKKVVSVSVAELQGLQGIVNSCEGINGLNEQEYFAAPTPHPTGVVSSVDFVKMEFEGQGFKGKWATFIGDPCKGFTAMVFGKPKFGKSYLCIDFAGYLSRNHGKVLYVAKEEELDATLQMKLKDKSVAHPDLFVSDLLPEDLCAYQFVFLDSVTKLKLSPEQLSQLEKTNPGVSFIYVFQVRKDGMFKGRNDFQHDVDIVIEVPERGKAVQYGRFNQGGELNIFETKNEQDV